VNSFRLQQLPWKLLLVSTGNISNRDLEGLLAANFSPIVNGFLNHDYIEITRANVIFHC
jgi:predicted nuclease of predicted toxin-antitoxin system